MKRYGKHLVLDLYNCDTSKFNRKALLLFLSDLCRVIDMKPEKLTWWDDVGVKKEFRQTEPHTKGTTVVQFILTSNITIHTKDILESVNLDVFSCKNFDSRKAVHYAKRFFDGKVVQSKVIWRY